MERVPDLCKLTDGEIGGGLSYLLEIRDIWRPNIVVKIKKELKELLINRGVKNFRDIIGKQN